MAKLTKQEVNALAAKAHREIEKNLKDIKNKLLEDYTPSTNYTKISTLLNDILYRNKQIKTLQKEVSSLFSEVYDLYEIVTGCRIYSSIDSYKDIDRLLNNIKLEETTVKSCPSIDEVKENIIIASIDNDFDAQECIKNIVTNYI